MIAKQYLDNPESDAVEEAGWAAYLNVARTLRDSGLSCRGAGQQGGNAMMQPRFRRLSTHALVFVTAGSGRYVDQDHPQGLVVPAPSIIWLTPGMKHAYGPGPSGWRECWVLFEGTMTRVFDGPDGWPLSHPVRPADPEKLSGIAEAFVRLRQALRLPNQRSQLVAATVAAHLVGTALDATARGPQERARSAVSGLAESAFTPLTVAERASALGLTVDTLHTMIREATGLSPHEFIIQTRLNRAQQLLADTASDVSAIAIQVGYDDPAYFSRLFRRRVGLSPIQFRRQEAARRP